MSAPMSSPERAARALWAAHYATPDGFRYMPCEELVRFVGRRRGSLGRVLEVGCGNGANLWYLAEHATQTVGLDFCERALRSAQELWRERRAGHFDDMFVQGSALALPLANGAFDTVVDCMVGQHVSWDDHVPLFREYRRVLRTGGFVFLYHLIAGTTGTTRKPEHDDAYDYPHGIALFPKAGRLCLPDAYALSHRLKACGFDRIEKRGMERTYPDGTRARYAVIEGVAHD